MTDQPNTLLFVLNPSARLAGQLGHQDDMKQFHGTYKEVCDKHDPEYYAKFKKVSPSITEYMVGPTR